MSGSQTKGAFFVFPGLKKHPPGFPLPGIPPVDSKVNSDPPDAYCAI